MATLVEQTDLPPLPHLLYAAVETGPYGFLLESSLVQPRYGRFSLLGSNPFLVFQSKGKTSQITTAEGTTWQESGLPLELLRGLLTSLFVPTAHPRLPFTGGAVGYLAYDLGRQIEKLPAQTVDDLKVPDIYLSFYDTLIAVDHYTNKVLLVAQDVPPIFGRRPAPRERLRALQARLASLPRQVGQGLPLPSGSPDQYLPSLPATAPIPIHRLAGPRSIDRDSAPDAENILSNFTRKAYCHAVQRAKDYIAAGDIFQVNLSQRLVTTWTSDPYQLYCRLRAANPAPFAAFLRYPEVGVASSSPERFLRLENGGVETRPIKGTRPRGANPQEDARLRQELWKSPKDRAELVMIVDLERNDLGRVCQYGSVQVPELCTIEEYATVFHLVSTVTGTLRPNKDLVDLLAATFPGGSITGAPKIRAMEIIEELEPVHRGIYTGSIGWMGFNGNADMNIVIRTFVVKDGRAYFQVGGGIVADSSPEAEYQETLDKARALIAAVSSVPVPG